MPPKKIPQTNPLPLARGRQWRHEIEGERIMKCDDMEQHRVMARWLLKRLATAPRLVAWHQKKFFNMEQELAQPNCKTRGSLRDWIVYALLAIAEQAPEYGGGHYPHSESVNSDIEFSFLVGSAMRAVSDMGIREDEVIAAYLLIYPER